MLKSKKCLSLKDALIYEPTMDFLESITNIDGLSVKDISAEITAESVQLTNDFHGDHADRIIVATAKCHGATLLARDQKILTWASLGHIKSLQA